MHRFFPCLPAIAVAIFAGGCVTVYQPLTSLQKPTAIEAATDNFAGQRMLIRCFPGDGISPGNAQTVCTRLSSFFSNQGAEVDVVVPRPGFGSPPGSGKEAKPDLVIELRYRKLHLENPPFMWVASVLTCTIIPSYREYSFAQDVSIRDADGFELASDSFEARFVMYAGAGIWAVNQTLDWVVRDKSEHMAGDASAKREFSRDFYRQLNQLAFNARVRAAVLGGFEPQPVKKASQ